MPAVLSLAKFISKSSQRRQLNDGFSCLASTLFWMTEGDYRKPSRCLLCAGYDAPAIVMRSAMPSNVDIVLTPAARREQEKRGSAKAYARKIEAGYPDR